MSNLGKYPDELRDRAVRMVLDHRHECQRSLKSERLSVGRVLVNVATLPRSAKLATP